jgi:hypothetical protein
MCAPDFASACYDVFAVWPAAADRRQAVTRLSQFAAQNASVVPFAPRRWTFGKPALIRANNWTSFKHLNTLLICERPTHKVGLRLRLIRPTSLNGIIYLKEEWLTQ